MGRKKGTPAAAKKKKGKLVAGVGAKGGVDGDKGVSGGLIASVVKKSVGAPPGMKASTGGASSSMAVKGVVVAEPSMGVNGTIATVSSKTLNHGAASITGNDCECDASIAEGTSVTASDLADLNLAVNEGGASKSSNACDALILANDSSIAPELDDTNMAGNGGAAGAPPIAVDDIDDVSLVYASLAVNGDANTSVEPAHKAPSYPEIMRNGTGKTLVGKRTFMNRRKRTYMNQGLGTKLTYTKPTSDRVLIKVEDALPVEAVWGWALIGHYVGPLPGHLPIVITMKLWGVNCRYQIERGWLIFEFDSEEDKDKVLLGGPYFLCDRPLILKNIPLTFSTYVRYDSSQGGVSLAL